MANRGEVVVQHIGGHADVPGHRDRHRHHHLLDAARALMLLGAVAAVSTAGMPSSADADVAQAFLGFVAWLLGVCLLSFAPVAGRFPQAEAVAGAAVAKADVILVYLFTPWN